MTFCHGAGSRTCNVDPLDAECTNRAWSTIQVFQGIQAKYHSLRKWQRTHQAGSWGLHWWGRQRPHWMLVIWRTIQWNAKAILSDVALSKRNQDVEWELGLPDPILAIQQETLRARGYCPTTAISMKPPLPHSVGHEYLVLDELCASQASCGIKDGCLGKCDNLQIGTCHKLWMPQHYTLCFPSQQLRSLADWEMPFPGLLDLKMKVIDGWMHVRSFIIR